jgi:hypothetical protein
MTSRPEAKAPPPAGKAQDPPPAPAQQTTTSDTEALYSAEDLGAAARSYDCYPWDVAGIFSMKGVELMTIPDFEAALAEWRQPIPPPEET